MFSCWRTLWGEGRIETKVAVGHDDSMRCWRFSAEVGRQPAMPGADNSVTMERTGAWRAAACAGVGGQDVRAGEA